MRGRRSAIVVPFRLPATLDALRLRESSSARAGVPAHVTILFPFVPPRSVDGDVLLRVAAIAAAVPAFDVAFGEVRRWEPSDAAPDGVVWLAPEPAAPFIALTAAIFAAFPEHPPYGGIHEETIPHLTLAADDRAHMGAVVAEARRHVPFRRRASAAVLIVEGDDGRWRTRRRFALRRGTVG
jgi:2'-5' RNA ligase